MIKNCKICGKEYKKKPVCSKTEWAKSVCCSRSCKHKWMSQQMKGKIPKNIKILGGWNRGISKYTSKLKRFRNSEEYKIWRISVYKRDGFTCQLCGLVGRFLNAHHIKPIKQFFNLRIDINNGITLCEDCHRLTHKKLRAEIT